MNIKNILFSLVILSTVFCNSFTKEEQVNYETFGKMFAERMGLGWGIAFGAIIGEEVVAPKLATLLGIRIPGLVGLATGGAAGAAGGIVSGLTLYFITKTMCNVIKMDLEKRVNNDKPLYVEFQNNDCC